MGLIENEDFVAITRRRENSAFAKIPGIIDAVVARGINFHDVEGTATVPRKFNATGADAAGSIRWAFGTIQAPGKNPCRGCFPTPPGATKQIGVINPVGRERMTERIRDMCLSNELSKGLRTVSTIQSSGHPWSLPGGAEQRGKEKTPRAPTRARLPLLRFRPGGVSQDSATRGAM